MKKSFLWVMMVLVAFVFTSCEQEKFGLSNAKHADIPGYDYEVELKHQWDSTYSWKITDEMVSRLGVYKTENGERTEELYDNTVNPYFTAEIQLAYKDYYITEDLLDPAINFNHLYRGVGENKVDEIDSLVVTLADAQKVYVPISVINYAVVTFGGNAFSYPTLKLISAEYLGLVNRKRVATRAGSDVPETYVSGTYDTDYLVKLVLEETNVDEPQKFTVMLKATAVRHLLSNNDEKEVTDDKKERVPIDSLTERCSFERVATYSNGAIVRRGIQRIIHHKFVADPEKEKEVDNFNHQAPKSAQAVKIGEAKEVEKDSVWTISGRTDIYDNIVENGVVKDSLHHHADLYHEKAVYDDGKLRVEFDFEPVQVDELKTKVSPVTSEKSGYMKADEVNTIGTTYLGLPQNLSQKVHLFKKIVVEDHKLKDGKVTVWADDSVTVDINLVDILSDGSEIKHPRHMKEDYSLVSNTNWKSTQVEATQTTSDITVGEPTTTNKKQGNFSYKMLTRKISSKATLKDGTVKDNGWTSKVPNNFVYEEDGLKWEADEISYQAVHVGATLTQQSENVKLYDYADVIKVDFGGQEKSSKAPGLLTYTGDDIENQEFKDKNLVATLDKVTAKATYVVTYKNGKEKKTSYEKTVPGSIVIKQAWTSNENNGTETTSNPSASLTSEKKTDDVWSWEEQKREITSTAKLSKSTQTNACTVTVPNKFVLTVDGKKCEFDNIEFTQAKVSSAATEKTKSGLTTTYDYSNVISVKYGSDSRNLTLPGTIIVTEEKKEINWELKDPKMTATPWQVTTSIKCVTYYNDNTTKEETDTHNYPGDFQVLTNWKSNEANANQSTGSASVQLTGSSSQTDGYWSSVRETRRIETKATLNGSTQTNAYQSVVSNNIVYSRKGKTHNFGTINFSATEMSASVVKSSETEEATTYTYTDNISVTYGSSINAQAPGSITVEKPWIPDFPDEFGKFTGCKFTLSRNKEKNNWVFVISTHFTNGTLPIILTRDSNTPEVNNSYFEYNTDSRFNSGNYIKSQGKWINSIASDEADFMLWTSTDNKSIDNMPYSTAVAWNWDNGKTRKGMPSVFTDRFSYSITHNGSLLTVVKDGTVILSLKAKK